jgi:hypothetical protein
MSTTYWRKNLTPKLDDRKRESYILFTFFCGLKAANRLHVYSLWVILCCKYLYNNLCCIQNDLGCLIWASERNVEIAELEIKQLEYWDMCYKVEDLSSKGLISEPFKCCSVLNMGKFSLNRPAICKNKRTSWKTIRSCEEFFCHIIDTRCSPEKFTPEPSISYAIHWV